MVHFITIGIRVGGGFLIPSFFASCGTFGWRGRVGVLKAKSLISPL